jgi:hypothetical protein
MIGNLQGRFRSRGERKWAEENVNMNEETKND